MSAAETWVRTGQAAASAQELSWFVILIVIMIGYLIWRDMK